MTYKRVCN